jgi:FkbM family methyltransferase
MSSKIHRVFQQNDSIEFWLDGNKKGKFASTLFSSTQKIITSLRLGVFIELSSFYIKCLFGLKLKNNESDISSQVYHAIILSFLNNKIKEHSFKLFDKERNIQLETFFKEKDAFLSILRILDEYAKAIIINQYSITKESVKDKVVVDGGANMGEFAIYCARLGAKKVYSFEPVPGTCKILTHQIKINGLENIITVVNKALGDKNEKVTISFSEDGDAGARIDSNYKSANSEIIDAVKLDDFLGNQVVGLIKLDVEGYEEQVLNGAKSIISRDKPVLALAAYHKTTDIERLPMIIKSIRPDYKITLHNKGEPDFFCE